MRDDIHKKVPRPPAVQKWVRNAVNDADRAADRSFGALGDAILDFVKREISSKFVAALCHELSKPAELFQPLLDATSPRDLNGRGGPVELEILTEAKRLVASGMKGESIAQAAIAMTLKNRVAADIRATESVLPQRDVKTLTVIAQMHQDARDTDFVATAASICSGTIFSTKRQNSQVFSMHEDLRA